MVEVLLADNQPLIAAGLMHFLGERDDVKILDQVAEKVAQAGLDLEELEAFVLEKIRAGAPLRGTYPPNEAVRAEYETWKKSKK